MAKAKKATPKRFFMAKNDPDQTVYSSLEEMIDCDGGNEGATILVLEVVESKKLTFPKAVLV